MKILSIAIPCYNSAAYMRHAVETVLVGGEDVEILIIDDGSSDETLSIAKELEAQHPGIVRAIHKENGGHGSAVNTGIKQASGIFFKVVDSDDWVNETAFLKAISLLKSLVNEKKRLDMLICNYVYDKVGEKDKKVIDYRGVLPADKIFTWNEMGRFKTGQYILMHSVIYRTELLRESGLCLPEHTFYVDNIYVYHPLPYVKKAYYLDVDLYSYFIGREDQSVNENNMMKRIDQQLFVTKNMIDLYELDDIKNKKLRAYMRNYLSIMMMVSSVFLIKIGDKESLTKKDELWYYLKSKSPSMYKSISRTFVGFSAKFRSPIGRRIVKIGYVVAQKIFKFN